MRTSITDVTYTSVRAPSGRILCCDRLVIEGTRVSVRCKGDTPKDLVVGLRQLASLVRAGCTFDEVWVQFPEDKNDDQ